MVETILDIKLYTVLLSNSFSLSQQHVSTIIDSQKKYITVSCQNGPLKCDILVWILYTCKCDVDLTF